MKMRLVVPGRELEFVHVELELHSTGIKDIFARKNNKTLAETLKSKKYSHLASEVQERYSHSLHDKLGEFLYRLKQSGDKFYRKFLNKYGDQTYCDFSIAKPLESRGLYSFLVNGKIMYIGRSRDPFEKRINQGYGHISPKNCYLDGQPTNCRLNSLIAKHWEQVAFYACPLEEDDQINPLEKALIKKVKPGWNIALKE